jgi:hypothetical protein
MAAGGREVGFIGSLDMGVRIFFKETSVLVAKNRIPHVGYKYTYIIKLEFKISKKYLII